MEVEFGVGYAACVINFENQTHYSTCVEQMLWLLWYGAMP